MITIITLRKNYELLLQIIFLTFISVAYLGLFIEVWFQWFFCNCVKYQQKKIFGMAFSSELFLQKVLNTPLDLKLETFISNSLKYSCLWMNCNRSKIIWYDILKLIYGLNFVIILTKFSLTVPEINLFNVTFNAIQPERSCLADCYLIRLFQCPHSKALPSDSHRFFTYYVT